MFLCLLAFDTLANLSMNMNLVSCWANTGKGIIKQKSIEYGFEPVY